MKIAPWCQPQVGDYVRHSDVIILQPTNDSFSGRGSSPLMLEEKSNGARGRQEPEHNMTSQQLKDTVVLPFQPFSYFTPSIPNIISCLALASDIPFFTFYLCFLWRCLIYKWVFGRSFLSYLQHIKAHQHVKLLVSSICCLLPGAATGLPQVPFLLWDIRASDLKGPWGRSSSSSMLSYSVPILLWCTQAPPRCWTLPGNWRLVGLSRRAMKEIEQKSLSTARWWQNTSSTNSECGEYREAADTSDLFHRGHWKMSDDELKPIISVKNATKPPCPCRWQPHVCSVGDVLFVAVAALHFMSGCSQTSLSSLNFPDRERERGGCVCVLSAQLL